MNARITATVTRKKFPKKLFAFLSIIASTPTLAWDGYDWERGSFVEIGKGNLVRDGREIEYYDYGSGGYKWADVESIRSYGSSVEIEIYDHDSGEYRTFEMDR